MNIDGGGQRVVTGDLDRSVANPVWAPDGSGLYFQYDDEGNSKVAFATLDGEIEVSGGRPRRHLVRPAVRRRLLLGGEQWRHRAQPDPHGHAGGTRGGQFPAAATARRSS